MKIRKIAPIWMTNVDVDTDAESGDVAVIVQMTDWHGNRRCGQIMFNANHLVEGIEGEVHCVYHIAQGMPHKYEGRKCPICKRYVYGECACETCAKP